MNNEEQEVVEVELIKEEDINEEVEDSSVEDIKINEDGTMEEVYRDKRTGNIVTHPSIRCKNKDNNRRELCWKYYLETVRDGNPSARASAIRAGFSENTAINIGNIKWFKDKKDKLRQSKMMTNSERNLARFVNMSITKLKKLEDGTEEEVFDIEKAKLVADISKFILSTIGKDKGYSSKTEVKVTAIPVPIMQLDAMDITPLINEPNEVTE
jgi:hypothetical protein